MERLQNGDGERERPTTSAALPFPDLRDPISTTSKNPRIQSQSNPDRSVDLMMRSAAGPRCHWHRLPDELAERVFARLSIASVLSCRCVCRRWRSLLSSDDFARLWDSFPLPRPSWFMVYHAARAIATYDPDGRRWNNLPVFDRCALRPSRSLPFASSGGLLCFRNRNDDYPKLTVCNPLVGSRRVLPPMSQVKYIDIVGMVADRAANSYMILVTGTVEPTSSDSITEVYDSRTEGWELHCQSSQEFLLSLYEVHAVWHDGAFYCLSTPHHRLIRYDPAEREWRDLEVWLPPGDLKRPSLLSCGGKLLLTGKLMDGLSSRCICIWELERLEWLTVGYMTEEEFGELDFPHLTFIRCYGRDSLVCFTSNQGWRSIMYDLESERWEWLPENTGCEVNQLQKLERNNLVGLPYEPSLMARA